MHNYYFVANKVTMSVVLPAIIIEGKAKYQRLGEIKM